MCIVFKSSLSEKKTIPTESLWTSEGMESKEWIYAETPCAFNLINHIPWISSLAGGLWKCITWLSSMFVQHEWINNGSLWLHHWTMFLQERRGGSQVWSMHGDLSWIWREWLSRWVKFLNLLHLKKPSNKENLKMSISLEWLFMKINPKKISYRKLSKTLYS